MTGKEVGMYIGRELNGVDDFEREMDKGIDWLQQKLGMMRDPSNDDYTANPLLIGRILGQIGQLKESRKRYSELRKAGV
jgi:hypothetical protein